MDQAARDVEEVSRTHGRRLRPVRTVLKSKSPGDDEAIEVVGPVMMPTRNRPSVETRLGHEDGIRLEGLVATDPVCNIAGFQIGPVNDFDPRHGLFEVGVLQEVLLRFRAQ